MEEGCVRPMFENFALSFHLHYFQKEVKGWGIKLVVCILCCAAGLKFYMELAHKFLQRGSDFVKAGFVCLVHECLHVPIV